MAFTAGFTVTHVVPESGLPTWPSPDASLPQGPRLAPGLGVQLLETTPNGWGHIACSNGWTAWVDPSRLGAPGTAAAAGAAQVHGSKWELVGQALRARVVLGPLGAAGGAGMAIASFLPWFSGGGTSVSGWDVGLYWVVMGTGDGKSGIKLGLPLVVAGAIVVLLAIARARIGMPVVIGLAAVGSWTAVFAISRVLRPDPHPDFGVGEFIALLGAALIAVDAYGFVKRHQGGP
jgi:hypothetical protein